jgi:hypothetical protein
MLEGRRVVCTRVSCIERVCRTHIDEAWADEGVDEQKTIFVAVLVYVKKQGMIGILVSSLLAYNSEANP